MTFPEAVATQICLRLDGDAALFKPPTVFARLFPKRLSRQRLRFINDRLRPAVAILHDALTLRNGSAFVRLSHEGFENQLIYQIQDPDSRLALRVHLHDGQCCIAAAVVHPA